MANEPEPDPAPETHAITAAPAPALPETAVPPVAPTPSGPPPWLAGVDLVLSLLLLVLAFLLGSYAAANSDVYMSLATGRLIANGDFAFGSDPFSWATEATSTSPAVPWIHHSWLFSLGLYTLFNLVDAPGLIVLKAFLFVALIGLLYQVRDRQGSFWLFFVCLAMSTLAISSRLFLQPALFSYLFLGALVFVLHRAGVLQQRGDVAEPQPRLLWLLPPLFVLWVNLDAWFVLGPIVLGLSALALALGELLGRRGPVSAKLLGAVFGAGLLACLLNPYHIRAFQLPTELACLAIQATEPLGLVLPDAVVGAGRTVLILRDDPQFGGALVSAFSPTYFQNPRVGYNAAGFMVFPLLFLGIISFILQLPTSARPAAPRVQLVRLVLWCAFAALAVLYYRTIPFFAIVAGPLTALNLSEYFRYRDEVVGTTGGSRLQAQLARLVAVPFLFLLLYMAWPGWLHGPADFQAAHRVSWNLVEDTIQRRTAEKLGELKSKGECHNVFNFSAELPHYCAWFAPEAKVKCFVDSRHALFAAQAANFAKARAALLDVPAKESEWMELFQARGIDHVVADSAPVRLTLENGSVQELKRVPFLNQAPVYWWPRADRLAQRFASGTTGIFAWSGPDRRWSGTEIERDWAQLAFVTPDRKPPPLGLQLFGTGEPDFWTQYLEGAPRSRLEVQECDVKLAYYDWAQNGWPLPAVTGSRFGTTCASIATGFAPGSNGGVWAFELALRLHFPYPRAPSGRAGGDVPYFSIARTTDRSTPSAPILAVRLARLAVGENPGDARGYAELSTAYQTLWHGQEEYWAPNAPPLPRTALRQMQVAGALYSAVQLQPENVAKRLELAMLYKQLHFFDFALEQVRTAEQVLLTRRAVDVQGDPENLLKQVQSERQQLEPELVKRIEDFQLKAANAPAWQKFILAVAEPYHRLTEENKEKTDPAGRGLVGFGLVALQEALNPENEKKVGPYVYEKAAVQMLRYLLMAGRINEAQNNAPYLLKKIRPQSALELTVYLTGVRGDYEAQAKALRLCDEQLASIVAIKNTFMAARVFGLSAMPQPPLTPAQLNLEIGVAVQERDFLHRQRFEWLTLLGATLLEAGDVDQAREAFQSALRLSPRAQFPEHVLAARYLALIDEARASR